MPFGEAGPSLSSCISLFRTIFQKSAGPRLPCKQISESTTFTINLTLCKSSPLIIPQGLQTAQPGTVSHSPPFVLMPRRPRCQGGVRGGGGGGEASLWVQRRSVCSRAAFFSEGSARGRATRAFLNSAGSAPSLSLCQKTLCCSFTAEGQRLKVCGHTLMTSAWKVQKSCVLCFY